ncbi:MAG TPA: hypothetical protein VHZ97_01040, partial [Pseudonocardiaceae bacterium]|nr:hypothetical protein [Pseudonocardiaceae bacterium]
MMRTILITTTAAALTVLGIAGCASGPTTRTEVCQQFDDLGQKYLATNGFFGNSVFDEAGDLADTASRYPGPDLSTDANALSQIANTNSTSGLELINATTHIAQLCGHPLGIGTTDFNIGNP